jgi:hypothetical protein
MTVEAQGTKHRRRPEKVVEVNGVDHREIVVSSMLPASKGSPDDFLSPKTQVPGKSAAAFGGSFLYMLSLYSNNNNEAYMYILVHY